ncbi:hypothetical protein [Micromonospora endolithica]|uniref:Uncharacterized protein n=1 Tax=Micromonospora endolithica TaxID=230091 RepID=A0A3A9YYG8_9ACTN|nr:hypothetical protein [Micromonospora endolithica]RKN41131.1 hypothetical protein D7223_25700 [Micromonospora endolithica]TWJ24366.1 hypothetical protein JD76_04516 [Micromonospora endolithica]
MSSVASVHPLWGITLRSLRDLTRLAVTAVALAIGLGGTTVAVAAPPPAAAVHLGATGPVAALGSTVARVEPARADQPARTTPPPAAPVHDLRPAAPVTVATSAHTPADEPGRDALTRRGPPRA